MPSIEKLYFFQNNEQDVYSNIALESCFLDFLPPKSAMLYLWQNNKTVVIGRNQCAMKECNLEALQAVGGRLSRRLSGGGAVFHDLGNLNFTFITPKELHDVSKQLSVISGALDLFGLNAVLTGRNDLEIDGRKFSGNAFYSNGRNNYHHGTIMLKVDAAVLTRVLSVDPEKYRSKGVESVRARVVNLCELKDVMDVPSLSKALKASFEQVYGMTAEFFSMDMIPSGAFSKAKAFFASPEWIEGSKITCQWETEKRFPWGKVTLGLSLLGTGIKECELFTDAMDARGFSDLKESLIGKTLNAESLNQALSALEDPQIKEDMKGLLFSALSGAKDV